jgi:polyphosphate glucokinase
MLFLGLGTGLGSALLWDRTVLSLELSDLPYIDNQTVEDQLGDAGRERLGAKNWEREVQRVVAGFKQAFIANYVVLGGGNAKLLEDLPAGAELGHNRNAFTGGQRLWQRDPRTGRPAWKII